MVKTLKILNIAAFSKMDFMHSLSRERGDIEVYGLDRQQSSPHFLSLVQFRQQYNFNLIHFLFLFLISLSDLVQTFSVPYFSENYEGFLGVQM